MTKPTAQMSCDELLQAGYTHTCQRCASVWREHPARPRCCEHPLVAPIEWHFPPAVFNQASVMAGISEVLRVERKHRKVA